MGHGSILILLQRSDPIFSVGIDDMSPAFNLEPKYVIVLTREESNTGPWTPPEVKGLV